MKQTTSTQPERQTMSTPTQAPEATPVQVAQPTEAETKIRQLAGSNKTFTMYAAANIMSQVLGQRVREQMLYNYRAKHLIKCTDGRVSLEDLIVFIQKRVDKNAAKTA